jgi:hypothetical protein
MKKLAIVLGLLIGQIVQAQNTEFVNYFKNKNFVSFLLKQFVLTQLI